MSIKVTTQPKNRISINMKQQEIKSVGVTGAGAGTRYLTQLLDVNATDADNNEILVYDEASETFIVKELPVINGGTF